MSPRYNEPPTAAEMEQQSVPEDGMEPTVDPTVPGNGALEKNMGGSQASQPADAASSGAVPNTAEKGELMPEHSVAGSPGGASPPSPSTAPEVEARLAEIEGRAAKATPGTWTMFNGWGPFEKDGRHRAFYIGRDGEGYHVLDAHDNQWFPVDLVAKREDFEFIATARDDVPWLCAALRAALTELVAVRQDNATWWLIEKPEPGGVYWWAGNAERRYPDVPVDGWPQQFWEDVNKAIRFRSRQDAESVLRLLPGDWQEIMIVTEHRWLASPAPDAAGPPKDAQS